MWDLTEQYSLGIQEVRTFYCHIIEINIGWDKIIKDVLCDLHLIKISSLMFSEMKYTLSYECIILHCPVTE
jgi:hypothetical protein